MPVTPRVLIVDDEASNRTFAEIALREAGYDVMSAANGPDALDVVGRRGPFDLFVVDVLMPQMAGDELGRQLRGIDPNARILYFTGYSEFIKRGVQAPGQEDVIEKPVSLDGLLSKVSVMLFGHAAGPRAAT